MQLFTLNIFLDAFFRLEFILSPVGGIPLRSSHIFEPEENYTIRTMAAKLDDAKELIFNEIKLGFAREIINDNENIYKIYAPT